MTTLSEASPLFIRCLKPNMQKVADHFDSEMVMNQLRYSGMFETVKIRRLGFPVRRTFDDFLCRYRMLAQDISRNQPLADQVK